MTNQGEEKQTHTLRLMSSACAGMFVFGIVMAILGAILPTLFEKFQFSKGEAGNLFLYMNLSMLVASLIFGPIVDRFGFKIFLVVCSLLVACSFLVFSFASIYSVILIGAVILGLGGGGLNGGTNTLTSDIHPDKRSSALNLLGIFFGFGALTIPFLMGTMLDRFGLNTILWLAIFFSFIPFILFLTLTFPKPKHSQGFPLSQAKKVIKHPLLWLCGFLLFFQSGNEFTIGGWISTYLKEDLNFSFMMASFVLAGFWAAIMLGRLLSSKIVKIVKNETLVLASALFSLIAAILIAVPSSKILAALGAVLIGFGFAAIFPTTLAVVGEIFPSFSGTAFSVIFVIALTGGMISPWLTGKIAQAYSLKYGMLIPVFNCGMIVIFQYVIIKVLKSRREMKS